MIPPSEKVLLSDQILPGPLRMGPPSLALWAYLTYFDDVFAVEGTVIEKNVQWGGAETVGTVDLKRVW